MRNRFFVLIIVGLAPIPLTAAAQGAPSPLERAEHSMLLAVGQTSNVGYWTRVGERTDLGIEGGFSFGEEGDEERSSISATLAVKRYWSPATSAVAPYATVGIRGSSTDVLTTELREYGAFGGVGLDWFPAARVSIGGHVALRTSFTRRSSPSIIRDWETDEGWEVRSFSSGIRLQLYF